MGYYLRVFCASDEFPPLQTAFEWAAARGVTLDLAPGSKAALDSPGWGEAEIIYGDGKPPLIAEVSRAGGDDELLAEEIEEFVEFVEDTLTRQRSIGYSNTCGPT
jgi:hypothetical protein